MTDHSMDAEAGAYNVTGFPAALESGMSMLLAEWQERRGVRGEGLVAGTPGVPDGRVEVGIKQSEQPEVLIAAEILEVGDKVEEGQLIRAVALPWFEILRKLERDPSFLHQLDWRKVEELIAGAYTREGWPEVILTHRSGDRGRDIIASRPGWGAIRFYDQVKAYKPGNRVPADDVRALVGVLTLHQNVSKAVITTTALFAPGVHDEMKALVPYRLELKDGPKLHEWLMGLGASTIDPRGPKGK